MWFDDDTYQVRVRKNGSQGPIKLAADCGVLFLVACIVACVFLAGIVW